MVAQGPRSLDFKGIPRYGEEEIAWLPAIENSRRLMRRTFNIIRESLGEQLGLLHTPRGLLRALLPSLACTLVAHERE